FNRCSVRVMSREPNPGRGGAEICGPPRSIQLNRTRARSNNHATSIVPRGDDRDPCLTEFVTSSCAINANPRPSLAESSIGSANRRYPQHLLETVRRFELLLRNGTDRKAARRTPHDYDHGHQRACEAL